MAAVTGPFTLPAEVLLETAQGDEVELGDYLDRVVVLQCLRYYG